MLEGDAAPNMMSLPAAVVVATEATATVPADAHTQSGGGGDLFFSFFSPPQWKRRRRSHERLWRRRRKKE